MPSQWNMNDNDDIDIMLMKYIILIDVNAKFQDFCYNGWKCDDCNFLQLIFSAAAAKHFKTSILQYIKVQGCGTGQCCSSEFDFSIEKTRVSTALNRAYQNLFWTTYANDDMKLRSLHRKNNRMHELIAHICIALIFYNLFGNIYSDTTYRVAYIIYIIYIYQFECNQSFR